MKNFQIIWLNPQIARTPDSHTRGGMGARRAALLAGVLIAHCTAVGRAGTPNAWSAVDLSGDVPGRLRGHGTAEAGGLLYVFGGNSNDIGRNNIGKEGLLSLVSLFKEQYLKSLEEK